MMLLRLHGCNSFIHINFIPQIFLICTVHVLIFYNKSFDFYVPVCVCHSICTSVKSANKTNI